MLLFAQLAAISHSRRQLPGRDRFLLLTGMAATRAGWPEVAARCHALVVASAPRHLLGRYATFADALRADDFAPFVRQTEKLCSVERAEHLLAQAGESLSRRSPGESVGDWVLRLLPAANLDTDESSLV